jgi:hypothetical protein
VGLAWRDNAQHETGFTVERAQGGGAFVVVGAVSADATGFTDRDLAPGTSYRYRVRAEGLGGASNPVGPVNVTTGTAAPAGGPEAPAGMTPLVARGSAWHFLSDGGPAPAGWAGAAFDDGAWKAGAARIGFGGDGELTTAGFGADPERKVVTTYFRRRFEVVDRAKVTALRLRFLRDDGIAVFLNGQAVARDHLAAGAGPSTLATTTIGGADEQAWNEVTVPPSSLVTGLNVLAAEVHQSALDSSDLSFDLELFATITASGPPAPPTTLSATSGVRDQVGLAWKDDAGDEAGYEVERSTSAFAGFARIARLGPNATGFTDRNRETGTTYFYRVRAFNAAGSSAFSPVAQATTGTAAAGAPAAPPPGAVVLVGRGSIWSYADDGVDHAGFEAPAFDDSGWKQGPARIGYGGDGERTTASFGTDPEKRHVTSYFRHTFTVPDARAISGLALRLLRDDGAIVTLNGVEIARSNMPATSTFATLASSTVADNAPDEQRYIELSRQSSALRTGTNVLAVEVHQGNQVGSDLSFDLELFGRLANPPPTAVTRGPYLQLGTTTSAVVRWRTSAAVVGRVRYGTSLGALSSVKDEGAARTEHEVTLSGLSPGTKYFYTVETTSSPAGVGEAEQAFETAPVSARPTRLWVLGSAGTGDAAAARVRDAFGRFAGARGPDLVLLAGDSAYPAGGDADFQRGLFDPYDLWLRRAFVWPALGNNDTGGRTTVGDDFPYFQAFTLPTQGEAGGAPSGTERYYSFDHGDIHFVVLDSMTSDRSATSAMVEWLKADLAARTEKWLVAVWHHPPYSKGSHDSDLETELVEMRRNVLPILEDGGADLVLTGHSHSYERSFLVNGHHGSSTELDDEMKLDAGPGPYRKSVQSLGSQQGTVYVNTGTASSVGGGTFDHPAMKVSIARLGSLVIDIDGDRLDGRFVDDAGIVQDHFTIVRDEPEVKVPGRSMVASLRAIADPQQRAVVSAMTLNALCTAKRAANGRALTAPEQGVADAFATLSVAERAEAQRAGVVLAGITPDERRELLGPLAAVDPGLCESGTPPLYAALLASRNGVIPRLRAPHCAGGVTYAGGVEAEAAGRAVTVATEVLRPGSNDVEFFRNPFVAPLARPFITGFTKQAPTVSGSSALDQDRVQNRDCGSIPGDGISPYGVRTTIACSLQAPCDQAAGMICGAELNRVIVGNNYETAACYAFPVVTAGPSANLLLRGYNFWDVDDAKLEFTPLHAPSTSAIVGLSANGVVANEGVDPTLGSCAPAFGRIQKGSAACAEATDPGNRTHNVAEFPVSQLTPGRFYRVRMMNHNGTFRHRNVADDPGRVLHACYSRAAGGPVKHDPRTGLPLFDSRDPGAFVDTRFDCQPPQASCVANDQGFSRCSDGAWSADGPRPLSACRHAPGTEPTCGETPEWFYSEPIAVTEGRGPLLRQPIVFVAGEAGFKLVSRLYGVRCLEESGRDWAGSDELAVLSAAFPSFNAPTSGQDGWTPQFVWTGGEFDSTKNQVTVPRPITPPSPMFLASPVGLNQDVSFGVVLMERDSKWVRVAGVATLVAVSVGLAACSLNPACAAALALNSISGAVGIVGGGSGLSLAWINFTWELANADKLGSAHWSGSAAMFGERYTVSHAPGFTFQREGQSPGPLPLIMGAGNRGRNGHLLILPDWVIFRGNRLDLDPRQTDSGPGDGHKLIGFREERRIAHGGANYLLQILHQRVRCDSLGDCQPPRVNPDPTQP